MRNFNPISPSSFNTITDNDNYSIEIKNNNYKFKSHFIIIPHPD